MISEGTHYLEYMKKFNEATVADLKDIHKLDCGKKSTVKRKKVTPEI